MLVFCWFCWGFLVRFGFVSLIHVSLIQIISLSFSPRRSLMTGIFSLTHSPLRAVLLLLSLDADAQRGPPPTACYRNPLSCLVLCAGHLEGLLGFKVVKSCQIQANLSDSSESALTLAVVVVTHFLARRVRTREQVADNDDSRGQRQSARRGIHVTGTSF